MYIDYDEIEQKKMKNQKLKLIIIIAIIIISLLIIALIGLIMYKKDNPTYITTYIDDVKVKGFENILDIQTDENGEVQFYIPIRKFASYLNAVNSEFGYEDYDGEYDIKTENMDSCYILRDKQEVAVYSKDSKIIYKKNLQTNSKEYEEYTVDKDFFINQGELYASQEGIETGYNVIISYNEKKKIITIYTLDYIVNSQIESLSKESFGNYGTLEYEDKVFNNNKSIFENVLIVKTVNKKYGVLSANHKEFVLEPKYDKISYIPDSKCFLVESSGKVGLFSINGTRKIDLIYDDIISMGKNSNLYIVKINNQYGVVDANEGGNIIIHPEYDQIGIDVSKFAYNGVKNGYIIFDELIPVRQNKLWALFDKKGKRVSGGFNYTNIGCSNIKSGNNIYPLLQIPNAKLIVVSDQTNKYGFIDLNGNDSIVPFVLEQIYVKKSDGKDTYWMTLSRNGEEQEINIIEYLNKKK